MSEQEYTDIDLLKLGFEGERAITAELFLKYGVTYPPRSIIIKEGERGSEAYLIISGKVVVCEKLKEKGNFKVIAALGPGEIFGEMAALEDETRSATLISSNDVKVLKLSRDDFNLVMRTHPRWAFKLLSSLGKRILNTFDQITEHYKNSGNPA